jgi:hypothetical protein
MTMRAAVVGSSLVVLAAAGGAALAQQSETVQSLLKQDFAIVGAITSPIGPGLFLQKKDKLYLCFVAETPKSDAVATKYCKSVQ